MILQGIKKMKSKKIISIMVVILFLGVFTANIHPVSATTTEIKASIFAGDELRSDWYIQKDRRLDVKATLHVDGGDPQWFRYIHFYLYKVNPDGTRGEQIESIELSTEGGNAHYRSASALDGEYLLCIIYWGSDDGEWPRADKEIRVHVRDSNCFIGALYPKGGFDPNKPLGEYEVKATDKLIAAPIA